LVDLFKECTFTSNCQLMKNYILVSLLFPLFFCTKNIVAATAIVRDTISPSVLESESKKQEEETWTEKEVKEPTMTDAEAANELIRAKDRVRKAKNALIFSIPTFGVFYPLALYWLLAALGPAIRARRHYRNFSKNKELIEDAEATYQATITLLIIHVLSLLAILIATNYFDLSSFDVSDTGALSVFILFLASLADFFVFNLFIPNKWKKKK
jgi:hypothetical protein